VSASARTGITPREAEVLAAVGSHLTNAQIASRLHLSRRTVDSHVASLLRKLGVADRRALADLAPAVGSGPALGAEILGLPAPWTSLVGRHDEIADVAAEVDRARLVTLVGPGGVGKTRLAIEAARAIEPSFPFGGAFVELVPVQADFVVEAVAIALGVTEQPGRTVEESVHGHLARRRALVVLDNCEHVLEAAATFVGDLLAACPRVRVLSTSRERLGVAGERVMAVNPLSTDGAAHSDAVRLFVERAQAQDPSFADDSDSVARLCVRLDGLPLAIELAAARVASVGARALLEATTDRLRLLAGGQGRHRSLRAVLDWSHDLLGEPEQRLLRRLGVFANGFDLDAVVAVASSDGDPAAVVDTLGHLVDKNLVVRRPTKDGATRWQLLETVRSYALGRLGASGEAGDVEARYRSWASTVAADLARRVGDGDPWVDEFDLVADDLRAALGLTPDGPDATIYELARATGHLAFARGLFTEAERHFRDAATHATTAAQAAGALQTAAHVVMNDVRAATAIRLLLDAADAVSGVDNDRRATCLAQTLMIARRFTGGLDESIPAEQLQDLLEDLRRLEPLTDPLASAWRAQGEVWMATEYASDADLELAEAALAEARWVGDPTLISVAADAVSAALLNTGRYREAYDVDRARLDLIGRMPGHEPHAAYEIDDAIEMAGYSGCASGQLAKALAAQEEAIAPYDVQRPHRPVRCAVKFPLSLALTGRFDEASTTAESMWSGWLAAGSPYAVWMAPALLGAALGHGLRGHAAAYQEWLRRVADLFPAGDLWERRHAGTVAAFTVARVALHAGSLEDARSVTSRYLDSPPSIPPGAPSYFDAYPRALAADVAAIAGSREAPALIDSAADVAAENRWAAACLDRARGRLSSDDDLVERAADAFADIGARFEVACTLHLLSQRADDAERLFAELGCPAPA
jgi:predicted ATPase/DNA-binding CsgD family transcriptional regulator